MFVIRPVQNKDLDALVELAGATTFGLTTLRMDRGQLVERIADSRRGFAQLGAKPRGESFLFVMEQIDSNRVVGTSGIVSKVGGFEPFYAYRIETSVHHSDMLNVHKEIPTLHLVAEHNGPCEIGSLFLVPDCRNLGVGRLLSLSRFLFIADHREHFDPEVIAEMRGVIDQHGHSAFWEALGRYFFEIEYPHADYLSSVNKRFIADLMPQHPIYVPLLPPAAQAVIGRVHDKTEPALRLLESEGFKRNGMVDIFEAGPVVASPIDQIRTIRDSVRATVGIVTDEPIESQRCLVSNARVDFRACKATIGIEKDGQVVLSRPVASALEVEAGQTVRYVTERAATLPLNDDNKRL